MQGNPKVLPATSSSSGPPTSVCLQELDPLHQEKLQGIFHMLEEIGNMQEKEEQSKTEAMQALQDVAVGASNLPSRADKGDQKDNTNHKKKIQPKSSLAENGVNGTPPPSAQPAAQARQAATKPAPKKNLSWGSVFKQVKEKPDKRNRGIRGKGQHYPDETTSQVTTTGRQKRNPHARGRRT